MPFKKILVMLRGGIKLTKQELSKSVLKMGSLNILDENIWRTKGVTEMDQRDGLTKIVW